MAGFNELLFGGPDQFKQLPTRNAQQMGIQSQLGNQISPLLQNLMSNKFDFGPIEQKARRDFETKTIPTLASRFQSLFGDSGARSSAFLPGLSSAGGELEQNLAAQQQGFNMQNRQQDQNLLSLLLGYSQQPSFENLFMPGRQGLLGSLAGGLGQGLGSFGGFGLNAGLGGIGNILGSLGSLFQPQENIQQTTQNNAIQALLDMLQRGAKPNQLGL